MAGNRRDLHKARLRRDRIRREKHAQKAGPPPPDLILENRFGAERSLRDIQAFIDSEKFESIEEINQRLAEFTEAGRLSERANAWKGNDPKWRAQNLAYDALETDDFAEALRLTSAALDLDPDCTDAQRLMVSLLPTDTENRLRLMREVVEKAERNLGDDFFRENKGHFWDVSTRPYMRARQHLAELLAEAGHLTEAIAAYERMLELNPDDNQGVRYPLLGLCLAAGRATDASRILSEYPDEETIMGSFAWARVLEQWLLGNVDGAEAALVRARRVNPFAERYLSGARELPDEMPEYYRPGEDSEAQVCARELAPAMQNHPDFRAWLRARR